MVVDNKRKSLIFLWPILYIILVVAACFVAQAIFNANYYSKFYISGHSMDPTLSGEPKNADYGIYDNHKSALRGLKRFQIVTTYYPNDHESLKIKRLLFKPGDTFEIACKYNDTTEKYLCEMRLFESEKSVGYRVLEFPFEYNGFSEEHTYPKTTLDDHHYFVAGDNWDNSIDSFDAGVGPIDYSDLVGVVVKVQGKCDVIDGKIENKRPEKDRFFNGVDY